MKRPEILSPVGNREMLEAAVRAGADAVYFGMSDFNARRNAQNFTNEEFCEAVAYCHVRGVRAYLTLNTLVSDADMQRALRQAAFAYESGIDAVIVQDLGLARMLRRCLPDLPLHASTQMTVHSPSALPILKKLGFVQVVLSREMSREEIRAFCVEANKYGIAVEVFVHGALCMCMSGQCYLSAVLGGRSGNRGLCAGPCRLPFSASKKVGYDLSLKDLSLVDHLGDLAALGVSSFKIEGRMKRPEYVAAATYVCCASLEGRPCEEWKEALAKVFSRNGFTDGYYSGHTGREMFGVRGIDALQASASVFSKLHELYRAERQSVALSAVLSLAVGREAELKVSDGKNTVLVKGPLCRRAEGRALERESVESKLARTGNTPFCFETIETELEADAYLSVSELNAMRREALERISAARSVSCRPRVDLASACVKTEGMMRRERKTAKPIARFSSLIQIPRNLEGLAAVVVPLESSFEKLKLAVPLIVDVPRGITSERAIFERLQEAHKFGVRAAFCGNLAACRLICEAGLEPIFDFSMNLFSSYALACAEALGARASVLSFELKQQQINASCAESYVGIYAYGRLPLMLMRNCPVQNAKKCKECDRSPSLTDRKGKEFPVRCRAGYSELFNSAPLWILDKTDDFCVDFHVLYFTTENARECEKVLEAYRTSRAPKGNFTRGLYYRGVE